MIAVEIKPVAKFLATKDHRFLVCPIQGPTWFTAGFPTKKEAEQFCKDNSLRVVTQESAQSVTRFC